MKQAEGASKPRMAVVLPAGVSHNWCCGFIPALPSTRHSCHPPSPQCLPSEEEENQDSAAMSTFLLPSLGDDAVTCSITFSQQMDCTRLHW